MVKRKITFDKEKSIETEKVILWKVVGLAVGAEILIIENTITGEWQGRYMSTGAGIKFKDHCLPIWNWGRDANDNQIEEVKKVYEFIKPPPEKHPSHADTCGCQDCKELNKAIEILENQKEK